MKSGYREGWLKIRNGCMNIDYCDILTWPSDYAMHETSQGRVQVMDHSGRVVASEDAPRRVRLFGYAVRPDDSMGQEIRRRLPVDCHGSYWVVVGIR